MENLRGFNISTYLMAILRERKRSPWLLNHVYVRHGMILQVSPWLDVPGSQ